MTNPFLLYIAQARRQLRNSCDARHKDQESLDRIHQSSDFKEITELAGQLIRQPPRLIQGAPLPGFEGNSKTAAAAFLVDSQWV
jgi:hypothetical protein